MTLIRPTHKAEEMKIGDGYTAFSLHGTRLATGGDTPYHGSGEVFAHATLDKDTTEIKVSETLRDLFIYGIDEADIADKGSFGGTEVSGFKIMLDRTIFENVISQEQSAIESVISADKITCELTVKELTFEKVALLLGVNPSIIESTLTKEIWTLNDDDTGGIEGDAATLKVLGIGGVSTIPFFSMMHRVADSRAAVAGGEVYEWHYFPRCQIDPSSEITFIKDDFIKMVAKIIVYPSKQLDPLNLPSEGTQVYLDYDYTGTDTKVTTLYYSMRSAEGKGMLFKIFREYVA